MRTLLCALLVLLPLQDPAKDLKSRDVQKRLAAARTLGRLAPKAGAEALLKKVSEKVADLSVFRLVTNFVSRWRIEVGR